MVKWWEFRNGGRNGGMVAEWRDGRMAGMATYLLFYGTRQQHRRHPFNLLIYLKKESFKFFILSY